MAFPDLRDPPCQMEFMFFHISQQCHSSLQKLRIRYFAFHNLPHHIHKTSPRVNVKRENQFAISPYIFGFLTTPEHMTISFGFLTTFTAKIIFCYHSSPQVHFVGKDVSTSPTSKVSDLIWSFHAPNSSLDLPHLSVI